MQKILVAAWTFLAGLFSAVIILQAGATFAQARIEHPLLDNIRPVSPAAAQEVVRGKAARYLNPARDERKGAPFIQP